MMWAGAVMAMRLVLPALGNIPSVFGAELALPSGPNKSSEGAWVARQMAEMPALPPESAIAVEALRNNFEASFAFIVSIGGWGLIKVSIIKK
jgi:hypothetical protein